MTRTRQELEFLGDRSSLHAQHVSHFGVAKVGAAQPVVSGNFPGTSLDLTLWDQIQENSPTLTIADGMAEMAVGTDAAGNIELLSRFPGRFIAGQVSVYQSGVRPGAGLEGNERRWGIRSKDGQDGLYFEWDDETFYVVALKAGTETRVASANFNGEDWTPGDRNNTFRIEYSAGRAMFFRAKDGLKVLLHEMVNGLEPLVNQLSDLHLWYANTNTGGTTDVSMYIRGASISVFGEQSRHNPAGAAWSTDYTEEIAFGRVPGVSIGVKFGQNPDVDTGTAPEDIWNGGDDYTGMNATANQNIEVFSSDADDVGSELSSGTVDTGSETGITDASADFVTTDGVAVGDLLINDTQGAHGIITAVDATSITVDRMIGDAEYLSYRNNPGDAYRVATAADTGAAVMRLPKILNADYEKQTTRYVILNGTTGVTVTVDGFRCSRGQVVLAGSTGANEGTLTARQITTTANVFMVMPVGANQTQIAADTVPAGKERMLKRIRVSIVRANGSPGSGTVSLRVRRRGEVFVAARIFDIQTGAGTNFELLGGILLSEGTDFKFRVEDVSDGNTIAEAAVEFIEQAARS